MDEKIELRNEFYTLMVERFLDGNESTFDYRCVFFYNK